jgi:hypothetical protein
MQCSMLQHSVNKCKHSFTVDTMACKLHVATFQLVYCTCLYRMCRTATCAATVSTPVSADCCYRSLDTAWCIYSVFGASASNALCVCHKQDSIIAHRTQSTAVLQQYTTDSLKDPMTASWSCRCVSSSRIRSTDSIACRRSNAVTVGHATAAGTATQ